METIIIICALVWLICGYIGWRLRFYGLMKSWYNKYGYNHNLAEESQANHWSYGIIIILLGGPASIIAVLLFREDIAWYFKPPKPPTK